MILGIVALGEGENDVKRRLKLWLAHALGGIVGGAGLGLAAIAVGTPIRTVLAEPERLGFCSAVFLLLVLIDLRVIRYKSRRRQVPATWTRRYGWSRAYFLYGIMLGSGLSTYVATAATYAVFAIAAFVLPPAYALLAGVAFGLARTTTIGVGSLAPRTISQLLYRSPASQRLARPISATISVLLITATISAG